MSEHNINTNKRTIYSMQERNRGLIFHWIVLMIGGLRHIDIENKQISPYYITMTEPKLTQLQKETFDIIKDKYEFIEYPNSDDIIINNFGEQVSSDALRLGSNNIDPECYKFVNKLFSDRVEIDDTHKNKKYFISRNNSHKLLGNGGVKRRHILNENELVTKLKEYGIEFINLEDYSLKEKINIFRQSSLIVGPNSGGLLFSIFSEKTNIVELNIPDRVSSTIINEYFDICKARNVPHFLFHTKRVDNEDNMTVDVDELILYMKKNNLLIINKDNIKDEI